MADVPNDAIVLEDSDGNYYVLPHELIELTRVDAEAKTDVADNVEDVSGFARAGRNSYRVMGRMKLPEANHWSRFSPNVGWPYYRPGPGMTDRINPVRKK